MVEQDNLTEKHLGSDGRPQYAVFLPAISSMFVTAVSKNRVAEDDNQIRAPAGIPSIEMLNHLNPDEGLFYYKWSLYSAGHADMDVSRPSVRDAIIRDRHPDTLVVGDSGGYQIAKGVWSGNWLDPNDAKVQKLREGSLRWLEHISDYAMTLDVPPWLILSDEARAKTGINTFGDAMHATQINNEYFMANRKPVEEGGAKFLNVLQGSNYGESDEWYENVKDYCDPSKYPNTHFNGWSFAGQNACSAALALRRIVTLMDDGLLEEGVHDWIHFLGLSRLEWAVLLTVIQRAIRRHHNPNLTISFDCASPYLSAVNAHQYAYNDLKHDKKWVYRTERTIDDKKYANDTRLWRDVILQDGHLEVMEDSPISERMMIKDLCPRGVGYLNKAGKETKSSWDTYSYAVLMAHNVHRHMVSVQEANRQHDAGAYPKSLMSHMLGVNIDQVIEEVFIVAKAHGKDAAFEVIAHYDKFLTGIHGSRGFVGKREVNAHSAFNSLFDVED